MMRNVLLKELIGGLWHTTHPERFTTILLIGSILPEPNMPNDQRWKTSRGPDYYPYVRTIGGVSLFDLVGFDPERYTERCPMSSWCEFIPYPAEWGCSVWIEIDRSQVSVLSNPDLQATWESERAYCHTLMPQIEAAHIGPLPRQGFKRAFMVHEGDDDFHVLPC